MDRILIIDDEEGIRNILGVYSEMLGYEPVLVAEPTLCKVVRANSQECTMENSCADILVVEQKLSGTTGLDFIQQQFDKGCTLPAHCKAVMSGALTDKEFMQAKEIGCYVLQKPVTFEIFENWVNTIK